MCFSPCLAEVVHPLTTRTTEFTLTPASSRENDPQYGQHMVGTPTQCFAWWPRCRGWCMAGVGLDPIVGGVSRRRRRRRVSILEGAHDRTGLGLGHPLAWRRESRVAHCHDGSGPFDHGGADRRTNGNDSLSCSDRTHLSGFLDHVFLWVLQESWSALRRPVNRGDRQLYTRNTIRALPQEQVTATTLGSDRRRYRT
jgi:hypothetical protein